MKTIEKTTDGGITWNTIPSQVSDQLFVLYPLNESVLLGQLFYSDWIISKDGGITWEPYNYLVNIEALFMSVNYKIGYILALGGTTDYISVSKDGGSTWKNVNNSFTSTKNFYSSCMIDKSNWWLCGSEGSLVSTTNGGITWEDRSPDNLKGITIERLAFTDTKNGVLITGGSKGDSYAYITTDGGNTWDKAITTAIGCPNGNARNISISPDGTFWVSGWNGVILKWKPDAASAVSEEEEISETSVIFPNPTSSNFKVNGIENYADISIKNSLGMTVKTILNVSSEDKIDISDLANGLYFVCVKKGENVKVTSVILHK